MEGKFATHVCSFFFQQLLHLALEDISWRQCMTVFAVLAIGALPEPSILFLLHSVDEILANNFGRTVLIICTVLLRDCLFEHVLIPVLHTFLFLTISLVGVDVHLRTLPFHIEVMAEFALESLGALPSTIVFADDTLGVYARGHLGLLYGHCKKRSKLLLLLFLKLLFVLNIQ